MTKKVLLLLPLVPLSAIGIVSVVNHFLPVNAPPRVQCVIETPAPTAIKFDSPPVVTPPSAPTPTVSF